MFSDERAESAALARVERGVLTPVVSEAWIAAAYADPSTHDNAQRAAIAPSDELIDELFAADAIVTRMETLAGLIADYGVSRNTEEGARYAITSVGSGPARELEEILKATPQNTRWDVTLIDQEPQALDYVYTRSANLEGRERLTLNALNISFRDMLSPSREASSFVNNDIIYSSGLVDYLNPLLARRFVKRLYEYVKPGGRVIIGTVSNLPTGMMWALEYVPDWSLYFRTEDEMRAIARDIPGAKVSVIPDPFKAIYFLVLEKPETP